MQISTGWTTHTAWLHLRQDCRKLATDALRDADPGVIAADKAALQESRLRVAETHGRQRVDVTV